MLEIFHAFLGYVQKEFVGHNRDCNFVIGISLARENNVLQYSLK